MTYTMSIRIFKIAAIVLSCSLMNAYGFITTLTLFKRFDCRGKPTPVNVEWSSHSHDCAPINVQGTSCIILSDPGPYCIQLFESDHCYGKSETVPSGANLADIKGSPLFNDNVGSFRIVPCRKGKGTSFRKGWRHHHHRSYHHRTNEYSQYDDTRKWIWKY